jgi:hypothetical protein
MGNQRRGAGDWAFGLPRATYEKGPSDEGRLDPLYRPASGLRTEQTCCVCHEVMPVGTMGARWASRRRRWRHGDCRWDLMPLT